jgi:TIGR03009 family protein
MRNGLVLTALLVTALPLAAQTPPARPATPDRASQEKLDGYLLRWEQEMKKIQTLAAELKRIDKDKTFETTTKLVGYARYMKVGSGARAQNLGDLTLYREGTNPPQLQDKILCTGTFIYRFQPAQKEIKVYEIPRKQAEGLGDDSFLSFFFGMRAAQARERYQLRLAKEDRWYIYVDILPRRAEDRADFQRARLVLNRDTFMPRQLWFESPNGNEVTWDIPRIQGDVRFKRADFDAPHTPAGWKVTKVPPPTRNVPPRVVRPKP